MDIDWFCYEWQYKFFPTDPIGLKFTGCIRGGMINICTKFEVIRIKSDFMSNLRFLIDL